MSGCAFHPLPLHDEQYDGGLFLAPLQHEPNPPSATYQSKHLFLSHYAGSVMGVYWIPHASVTVSMAGNYILNVPFVQSLPGGGNPSPPRWDCVEEFRVFFSLKHNKLHQYLHGCSHTGYQSREKIRGTVLPCIVNLHTLVFSSFTVISLDTY